MVFQAKKDRFRWVITAFVFCIYSVVAALIYFIEKDISAIFGLGLVWSLLFILIIWIIPNTTKYTFLDDHLLCQSVGFKKRIPYNAFKKLEPSNGLYAGWKMSTAWKCLILHYNKYDELLISPANEEEFISLFNEKKAQFSELN
ncbi:MAG: Bacterial domain [Bacteroidota bacterium]|jgi:energy-coupling factor transporter transmembrane protein EcfT